MSNVKPSPVNNPCPRLCNRDGVLIDGEIIGRFPNWEGTVATTFHQCPCCMKVWTTQGSA